MNNNSSVFNLLRLIIFIIAVALLVLAVLSFFDIIYERRTYIWAIIAIPFIVILMLLGKFYLSALKHWHIYSILITYWGIIVGLMFLLSGYETHRTYIIKHDAHPGVVSELAEVFGYHLHGKIKHLEQISRSETRFVRRGVYYQKIEYGDTLNAILSYKPVVYPDAEIVINDYDDKRLYDFSKLTPGDVLSVKLKWDERFFHFRTSVRYYEYREGCWISIPIEVSNQRIYVNPQSDPDLTLKRLTFWAEKFTEEEEKSIRGRMMVHHDLRFRSKLSDEFFNYLVYDKEGDLFLPVTRLKIDFLPMDSCNNSSFLFAKILQNNKNPYLIRLLFPALSQNMKDWSYSDEQVFVGFKKMLEDFPIDFQRRLERIF